MQGGDTFIKSKRTYDAFHGTELLEVLRRHGVRTLIVSGSRGWPPVVLELLHLHLPWGRGWLPDGRHALSGRPLLATLLARPCRGHDQLLLRDHRQVSASLRGGAGTAFLSLLLSPCCERGRAALSQCWGCVHGALQVRICAEL